MIAQPIYSNFKKNLKSLIMALTINRKNEITEREFDFLKNRFNRGTNSQAIYAAVKYLIYEIPDKEKCLKDLKEMHEKLNQKYDSLIMALEIKHIDNANKKNSKSLN